MLARFSCSFLLESSLYNIPYAILLFSTQGFGGVSKYKAEWKNFSSHCIYFKQQATAMYCLGQYQSSFHQSSFATLGKSCKTVFVNYR